ncbi:oxidoreductase [Nocardia sp. 852002-20019_SCH5090214]|uniref:Gfo/Idh/MocA family protein n=1 Tax=Nocardia sp. 852002-20019_SCH5090214 TaxID=1834087 RepID=UPI0007EA16C8|nr:Gfo/Idh/MocA family oxidoreductase [Nocardia sp. 852002-20019_SCH5090214]OBA47359.1 oxidoreductase [Nocardia sp. 852002-20019_SCH5090214]
MAQVNVAVIGYGLSGAVFHAPLIAADPRLRMAAVVTSSPERADQARADHPGVRVFATVDELFCAATDIDLVVIASPNRTHEPLTLRAVAAGLPVVVDKPFALTAVEGEAMIEAARRAGVMLTVFQNRRWDSDFRTVRRLMTDGALGEVRRFESRFERWRPHTKGGWREVGGADEGAGILYDLGSHLIDQALDLFGPVEDVYCELDARRPGVLADDDAFVALTHASGVRSHLWMSAVAPQLGPRLRVLGSEAGYVCYGLDPQEAALRAGRRPGDGQPWGSVDPVDWGQLGAEGDLRLTPSEPGAYPDFYAGVAAALLDGGEPPVDPADAVAALRVIERARAVAAR